MTTLYLQAAVEDYDSFFKGALESVALVPLRVAVRTELAHSNNRDIVQTEADHIIDTMTVDTLMKAFKDINDFATILRESIANWKKEEGGE